jgi:hypothetical protein
MSDGKFSKRMLAAAGSLAGLAAAQHVATEAALIHVSDRPVTAGYSDGDEYEATWDIDGTGNWEFSIVVYDNPFTTSIKISSSALNGRGFVGTTASNDNIKPLSASMSVGASQGFGPNTANNGNGYRRLIASSTSNGGFYAGDEVQQLVSGSNLIGFRFDGGSGYRYGYAKLDLDFASGRVTIPEWWYDDSGAPVHVEAAAVPEPNTLALLALGCAGLVSYRATRKPRPTETTTETAV